MAEWTCRCSAKNGDGDRYCEGCGAENPKAPGRHLAPAPKVPEMNRPAVIPTYGEPTPEDDELIRAEMAKVNKLLGIEPKSERLGQSPAVNPEVRAKLARRSGPESIGDLLDRQAKGAPR